MNAAAIVLAAGESSRMGSPKALLPFQGSTFLGTLLATLRTSCDPVIVVLGHHADAVRAEAGPHAVVNPDPDRGMLSSLQCGIAAVPAACDGALFIPVDHPRVAPSTVAAVLSMRQSLIACPVFNGKRGHPVWIRRDLFAEILAEPEAAHHVIRRHGAARAEIPVDDPAIHDDIDTPDDYRRLIA